MECVFKDHWLRETHRTECRCQGDPPGVAGGDAGQVRGMLHLRRYLRSVTLTPVENPWPSVTDENSRLAPHHKISLQDAPRQVGPYVFRVHSGIIQEESS